MAEKKTYTLRRHERIKSRKKIELLFREGKHLNLNPLNITYILTEEKGLQVGVGAGKRFFKKAVHRNKIKRLLRESWRLQKNVLAEKIQDSQKGLAVFVVYTGKEIPSFSEISSLVKQVLERLLTMITKEENKSFRPGSQ
jgi:ribonuclease P protein component